MKLTSIANMVSGSKALDPIQTTPYQGEAVSAEIKTPVAPISNLDSGSVGQQREGSSFKEDVSEAEADRRMKSVIDQANEKVKHTGNRQLAFSYNENTKRISIKVYDALTKEIIREIPPEKTLEMLERVYDLAGIMVDEKR